MQPWLAFCAVASVHLVVQSAAVVPECLTHLVCQVCCCDGQVVEDHVDAILLINPLLERLRQRGASGSVRRHMLLMVQCYLSALSNTDIQLVEVHAATACNALIHVP